MISTHTINLQEQLFNKDIPLLRTALGIDFSAALLKGRQNYLCHTRLRRALAQMDSLFTQGEAAELKRIQDWALRTQDGTLSDMASAVFQGMGHGLQRTACVQHAPLRPFLSVPGSPQAGSGGQSSGA